MTQKLQVILNHTGYIWQIQKTGDCHFFPSQHFYHEFVIQSLLVAPASLLPNHHSRAKAKIHTKHLFELITRPVLIIFTPRESPKGVCSSTEKSVSMSCTGKLSANDIISGSPCPLSTSSKRRSSSWNYYTYCARMTAEWKFKISS